MFFSPLEQFNLIFFCDFYNFNIGNNLFFFFLIIIFIYFLKKFFFKKILYNSFFQKIIELLYSFILEILLQQTGKSGVKYFPFIISIFIFILLSNLIGMLPFSFTLTAHLSITFFLAFSFNLGFIILGFFKNSYKFLYLFLPTGTPIFLLPLIIIIEIVSYLIRTFSLSIRLFANMMAGHCLLFVISMFVFNLLSISNLFIFIIFIIYLMILILEFSIAFLQAYVFTILLCIYLNDSLHPIH
jgi:F-type H+-transporting ATPase subunit a